MLESKRIEIIKDKILNENINFNSEELLVLSKNQDLMKLTLNLLNKKISSLNNSNEKQMYLEFLLVFLTLDVSLIYQDISNELWTEYFIFLLNKEFKTLGELRGVFVELNLSNNLVEKILKKYMDCLKENKYDQVGYIDNETLMLLLDYKRYDLISIANFDATVTLESLKKVSDIFKQQGYLLKHNFRFFELDKYADFPELLSLDSLIMLITKNETCSSLELQILNQKLENIYKEDSINLYHQWNLLFSILPEGYKELIINKILEYALSGKKIIHNYYLDDCPEDLFDFVYDKRLINAEIQTANFIHYDKYDQEDILRIIELIENDLEYRNKIIWNNNNINSKLLETIIKYDISIKYLDLINSEIYSEIILSFLRNGKEKFNFSEKLIINSTDELLLYTLKNKNYDLLLHFDFDTIEKHLFIDEYFELLQVALKENILFSEKFINRILSHHNQLLIQKILNYPKYLETLFFISKRYEALIYKYLKENDQILNNLNSDVLEYLFLVFTKDQNLNQKNLRTLKNKFGYKILLYLENENIKSLINLPDDKFLKVINLFSETNYSKNDLETAYDAIKQYEFGLKNPEVISIFENIKMSLENGDDNYLTLFLELEKVMDTNFYEYFNKIYKISNDFQSSKELLLYLANKIKNNENVLENQNVLHTITTYYLDRMRGEYKNNYNVYTDLNINYLLEEKSTETNLINYLLKENPLINLINDSNKILFHDLIIQKLIDKGMDQKLIEETIYYYINHEFISNSKYEEKVINSNIKNIILTVKECLNLIDLNNKKEMINKLDKENKIKRIYELPNLEVDILKILSELKISLLEEKLLTSKSEEIYNHLVLTLKKYKMHLLPEYLINYLNDSSNNLDIKYDYVNLAQFINYYYSIYETYKINYQNQNKNFHDYLLGLIEIINNSTVYSEFSIDSLILSQEDYRLIKINPPANEAKNKTTKQRINESVARTFLNFERKEVTIPTFNEEIFLDDKSSSVQVIVGNFTNPTTLTHGERTGACMRIGGEGEDLYNFCLDNPNGFHIRFADPKTGKYISRVSGFRNGNTLFLNQLRKSCEPNLFPNSDLIKICQKVARLLIEKSKNSTCPIENVVISKMEALKNTDMKEVDLGVNNIKEGLPGKIYSDIKTSAVVLATTSNETDFVPINFDKSNIEIYLPSRDSILRTNDKKQAYDYINRIHFIKAKLDGEMYQYLKPLEINELIYCISNQDWYIYVTEDLLIHEEIIDIDSRAKIEYLEAKKEIEKFINLKKETIEGEKTCNMK